MNGRRHSCSAQRLTGLFLICVGGKLSKIGTAPLDGSVSLMICDEHHHE